MMNIASDFKEKPPAGKCPSAHNNSRFAQDKALTNSLQADFNVQNIFRLTVCMQLLGWMDEYG
jgi:hypothetical protein